MTRSIPWLLVLLLSAASLPALAAEEYDGPSPAFGVVGGPDFSNHSIPGGVGAPEPTLGIPWGSDSLFFHAGTTTFRAVWDDNGTPTWTDVTPPYQVPFNFDPMLHADPDTGRIWAGGLHTLCSFMMYSDDDGESWLSTQNMCSGIRFDHQSLGSGPPIDGSVTNPLHPHYVYYCAQLGSIGCATSLDGGATFGPFQDVPGPCGGFHGHVRVSRLTGFVVVPVAGCGDDHGFIATNNNGISWASYTIPGTEAWTNGFDPSMQFSRDSGWLYYGQATEDGVHIALSRDEGNSWDPLGGGHGLNETWLDIGALHDPPILSGVFADVQTGDDDRVAFSFIGLERREGVSDDFLRSEAIYMCDDDQEDLVWYYYIAVSYDAGENWNVSRVSDDPVQVGGIYDSLVSGSGDCRNLLDFNDMDIDSTGRIYIGFGDGCVDECAETEMPDTTGYRERVGFVYRQETGRSLFSEYDIEWEFPAEPEPEEEQRSNLAAIIIGSASILILVLAAGFLYLVMKRKRG